MDTGGAGVEGGRTGQEIGIDIYARPCVRQTASENLLYSSGSSARGSENLKGRDEGTGGGRSPRRGCYVYI